jgi:hypothetical protein
MSLIARMLTSLLMGSAWLLGPDRAEWLEGLVAEATETRGGRGRVAWLLGGVWLVAGELLGRSAIRVLTFIAAAGIVVWVVWPGSSSDYAVPVNRIVVPVLLGLLALVPLLVRRSCGSARRGLLPRTVRVVGYLVVLAVIAGHAFQEREGQKLGAYFGAGFGGLPMSVIAGIFALVLAGYAATILILTSQRVHLTRAALPIAIGTGTLTGVAMYALFTSHLWSGGMLVEDLGWGSWGFVALGLPLLTGFAVARLAARDTPANGMIPARQGSLAAVCGTGTAVLVLAALTAVTIAISPQKVPLQTPAPTNGVCETCDPVHLTIPPHLRQEYWVGLSIAQAAGAEGGTDWMLVIAPLLALCAGGLGTSLPGASQRRGSRGEFPRSAQPPAPSGTQV